MTAPRPKSRTNAPGSGGAAEAGAHPAFAGLPKAVTDRLWRLQILSPDDLVLHLPLRYEDETRITPIRDARSGDTVLVQGVVTDTDIQYRPRRQLVVRMEDPSGDLVLRFLNFYPSQVKAYAPGVRLRVLGDVREGFFGREMVHPRVKPVAEDEALPESLTPVYPTTAGLSQALIARTVARFLTDDRLGETLPPSILARLRLPGFRAAVLYLHRPPPEARMADLESRDHRAWRRLKFDELLAQQLSMRLHYRQRRSRGAPVLAAKQELTGRLLAALPFRLTGAQERVWREVSRDLAQPHPMQRLLQGDVGSGKTVVAALAALQCIENGRQAAIMAPTEILAEQHQRKIGAWLDGLGVPAAWLAGSLKRKDRREALERVATGEAKLAIGTHALFQEQVGFRDLGLAIVDEQHRFGVHQRLALRMKGGQAGGDAAPVPHQLMMSATPIPRTLSMSFYADLDVSVIDELPPDRTPVTTKLVSDARRDEVLGRVRDACLQGRQAYWVCPLIEESEALQLKTALETFERLRTEFPDLKVGLVHGRLAPADKAAAMGAFAAGEIQLLVATTVIEVGVDVPNATLMVIEHAERMGLAQLHQLRGRVGRGAGSSACILLYAQPLSETARERLKIIYENNDGFEIARQDLRLRGPGEFLGVRQSGVPMLRFADLEADADLLEAARDVAGEMLDRHPEAVELHLRRWLGGRGEYLRA